MAMPQPKQIGDRDRFAQRFGSSVGRWIAKVTPSRNREMTSTSAQLALACEQEEEIAEVQPETELIFRMQTLSRRRIKARVLEYRDAEPRFVYDGMNEETAAVWYTLVSSPDDTQY